MHFRLQPSCPRSPPHTEHGAQKTYHGLPHYRHTAPAVYATRRHPGLRHLSRLGAQQAETPLDRGVRGLLAHARARIRAPAYYGFRTSRRMRGSLGVRATEMTSLGGVLWMSHKMVSPGTILKAPSSRSRKVETEEVHRWRCPACWWAPGQ